MNRVKITVIKKVEHTDIQRLYENPIEHACNVNVGDEFISDGWNKPEGFCGSAWESIQQFVRALGCGGSNFYEGWMKDPNSACISCNDGFRPVSFLLEAIE